MRLNRFVAAASELSRRAADEAIRDGRVRVDHQTADLTTVLYDGQLVTLDGQELTAPEQHHYVAFHKPVGYVCSRRGQGGDKTIYELLPQEYQRLQSVGRLDRESSGLLLLSDDGDYIQRQLHPSQGKVKTYELTLSKALSNTALVRLREGVKLNDGISHLTVTSHRDTAVTVELIEGRNRQIRRTFHELGNEVVTLHRTRVGGVRLGDLPGGKVRSLSEQELTS